jgi:transposase
MLVKENESLREINSKLVEEINRLKERLNLNSTNSSLPPSRDINRQRGKNRSKSGRKPGGQPGHKGHSYQAMEADKIINLFPSTCSCGEKVEIESSFTREQKIEIPTIKPYVTEYRRWYGKCSCCQKKMIAPLPEGVSRELLGDHAKTIICALNGFFHNSKRDVQEMLQSIFNLSISLGLIWNTARRVSKNLEEKYAYIQEEIRLCP